MLVRIAKSIAWTLVVMAITGANISYAAHRPKTHHQCAKHKDMHWDAGSQKCLKN